MKLTTLITSVAALGLMVSTSQAATTYVSVDAGAVFIDENDAADLFGIEFDTATAVNAAVGFKFDSGFAIEGQIGYIQADYSGGGSFEGINISASGETELIPIFANVKYSQALGGSPVSLELGLGAGVVYSSSSVDATGSVGSFSASVSASEEDWSFCAQALAGLNFKLSDTVDFKVGYRLLTMETAEFEDNILGHYVGAGFNFRF